MYIYIFKDKENNYIGTTEDENINDLANYRKGESWLLNDCTTYITDYINKEYQKNIDDYIQYYKDKFINNKRSKIAPIGIDEISITKSEFSLKGINFLGEFNPIDDIWIKSQEVEHVKIDYPVTYKVDSFVTKDRKHLYNIIYIIGFGTSPNLLEANDFEQPTFSNYIDYSSNWGLFTYDNISFVDINKSENERVFMTHPDNIYQKEKKDLLLKEKHAYKKYREGQKMVELKYFDDTSDGNLINKSIEDLWVNTMKKYNPSQTIWSLDKIHELINSIQKYFYLREQKKWIISSHNLRKIIQNLATVSATLADIANGKIQADKGQLDYMSKKLAYIFTLIDKDLSNW